MRFAEAMARRTDDELIEIVSGPPDDWESEAIEAAKAEVERRGLRWEPSAHPYRGPKPERSRSDPGPSLVPGMKVAALLLGVFLSFLGALISLAVMSAYTKKGQRRMGTDFATWAIIGAAISAGVAMLSGRC